MQRIATDLVASGAKLLKEDHGQCKGGIVDIWICTYSHKAKSQEPQQCSHASPAWDSCKNWHFTVMTTA